jgi:predicted phage terminase large subunit-like protein
VNRATQSVLTWKRAGIPTLAWSELALHLKACVARRVRCESRDHLPLLDWGRRYLPHYFQKAPSGMHRWLADRCDAITTERGAKLNVIGPRGGAKSTLGTLTYVLRAAVEGWEPYIWIISDTHSQARGHLENLKLELAENAALAADYPQATGKGSTWRAVAIRLRNGVTIEAFGTGQRLRGRRIGASRPSLIVCDDLQNDDHIRSARARDTSQQWFEGTLLKAGVPQTNIINLATALHRDALALKLDRTPGWNSRVFQAISQWPEKMSLWHDWEQIYCDLQQENAKAAARAFYEMHQTEMDAGAELLWPELEDLYTLMRMRVEGGRTAFEREKQGSPLSPDACEWPAEYFDEHLWFDEWPSELQLKIIALDPSKGRDARRGDYSAFILLGIDRSGDLYVDANLARRPTPEIVADGVELCRTFRPDAFGVESNQFQELLADEFAAEFRRQNLVDIHPWSIDNRVSKAVRIRRLGPYLSGRRLRFKNDSPGAKLLVEQLQEFPAADHDDGPDALEMAIRLAGELLHGSAPGDNLGDHLPLGV